MILRRSKRTAAPKVIWEAKDAPSTTLETRIIKKAVQTVRETVLESVVVNVLSEAIELDENDSSEHLLSIVTAWEHTGAPSAASDP